MSQLDLSQQSGSSNLSVRVVTGIEIDGGQYQFKNVSLYW